MRQQANLLPVDSITGIRTSHKVLPQSGKEKSTWATRGQSQINRMHMVTSKCKKNNFD